MVDRWPIPLSRLPFTVMDVSTSIIFSLWKKGGKEAVGLGAGVAPVARNHVRDWHRWERRCQRWGLVEAFASASEEELGLCLSAQTDFNSKLGIRVRAKNLNEQTCWNIRQVTVTRLESDKKHDFVDRPISDDFYLIAVMRGNIYTLHW